MTVVLTDDISTQTAARAAAPHARVEPLCAVPSFWDVSAAVRELVTRIDQWQASLAPSLPAEILHWGVLAEGGVTQRVQDALLFISAADTIVARHRPVRVHLVREPGFEFEDDVLAQTFNARGVRLTSNTLSRTSQLKYQIAAYLRPYAVFVKRSRLLAAGMWRGRLLGVPANKPLAVFQLGGSDARHIDNIREFMSELKNAGGLTPVALTNGLAGGADQERVRTELVARGLVVSSLESYASPGDLAAGLVQSASTYVRSVTRMGAWNALTFKGVRLAPFLRLSRTRFFLADVPFRIVFFRSLRRFLARHRVDAFKPWGGSDLFDGRLGMRLVRERNGAARIFHYWLGLAVRGWPYHDASPEYRPDIFLAKGEYDREICIAELGMRPDQVVVVGHMGASPLDHESDPASLDPVAARHRLNMPLGFSRYVAVDVSGSHLGYLLKREQVELIEVVLMLARSHPSALFALKPHPSYSMEEFMPLIEGAALANVMPLRPKVAARDFILACDVTLSKYSTLLLEAAMLGRPTISALLDGDSRFKMFEDMPHVVLGRVELTALLEHLLANAASFDAWAAERLRIQEEHLARFVARAGEVPPATRAADALLKAVTRPCRTIRSDDRDEQVAEISRSRC